MKYEGQTFRRTVAWVRLYLEDYEELVQLLTVADREAGVSADNFRLESPEEISAIKSPTVRELEITSSKRHRVGDDWRVGMRGYIHIDMHGPRAEISVSGADYEDEGIFQQITRIFNRRRLARRFVLNWKVAATCYAVSIGLAVRSIVNLPPKRGDPFPALRRNPTTCPKGQFSKRRCFG